MLKKFVLENIVSPILKLIVEARKDIELNLLDLKSTIEKNDKNAIERYSKVMLNIKTQNESVLKEIALISEKIKCDDEVVPPVIKPPIIDPPVVEVGGDKKSSYWYKGGKVDVHNSNGIAETVMQLATLEDVNSLKLIDEHWDKDFTRKPNEVQGCTMAYMIQGSEFMPIEINILSLMCEKLGK